MNKVNKDFISRVSTVGPKASMLVRPRASGFHGANGYRAFDPLNKFGPKPANWGLRSEQMWSLPESGDS